MFTREILGWNLKRFHNTSLVLNALKDALDKNIKPIILHSDQGSEYTSIKYIQYAQSKDIQISMSKKASP